MQVVGNFLCCFDHLKDIICKILFIFPSLLLPLTDQLITPEDSSQRQQIDSITYTLVVK